jgi:hypothetical protein
MRAATVMGESSELQVSVFKRDISVIKSWLLSVKIMDFFFFTLKKGKPQRFPRRWFGIPPGTTLVLHSMKHAANGYIINESR